MKIEGMDIQGNYYIKELPDMYEYEFPNGRKVCQLNRYGDCMVNSGMTLLIDELDELDLLGEYGKKIKKEALEDIKECCEYCGNKWTERELTVGDMTFLTSKGFKTKWLKEKLLKHNYLHFFLPLRDKYIY